MNRPLLKIGMYVICSLRTSLNIYLHSWMKVGHKLSCRLALKPRCMGCRHFWHCPALPSVACWVAKAVLVGWCTDGYYVPRDDCQNVDLQESWIVHMSVPSTCTEVPGSHAQGPKPWSKWPWVPSMDAVFIRQVKYCSFPIAVHSD